METLSLFSLGLGRLGLSPFSGLVGQEGSQTDSYDYSKYDEDENQNKNVHDSS